MSLNQLEQQHGITISKRRTAENFLSDEGPYAKLLNELVTYAKERGASDIHIEPTEMGVSLRLRVNGDLLLFKKVSLEHRESLILEVKRIFGLSIGTSGKPQDGRASLPNKRLDLRVSLIPTHFGEKVVMRLLDLDASFEIKDLGFSEDEEEILKKATQFENGVVIVSGPTGSGKTRLLYSLLKAIDPKRHNIVTLEDPIEYRIEGLNQIQVNHKMTFADALRSVLRQDPDVILVGEIRDPETAKLCFQAAETGHLVFSTLHANGAMEVIERLKGLGVDKLTLQSNLRLALAQRLEQSLCDACSERVSEEFVITNFRRELDDLFSVHEQIRARRKSSEAWRCQSLCQNGIAGRLPILEWAAPYTCEETGRKKFGVEQTLRESALIRMFRGEIHCEGAEHEE